MQKIYIGLFISLKCSLGLAWNYPTTDYCAQDTQLAFLHDVKNRLTPESALVKLRSKSGLKSPQMIHYGYTNGTVWLYVKTAKAKEWQKCSLELANPQLDHVDIYYLNDGKIEEVSRLGDAFIFNKRPVRVRNYVFPFRADHDHEFVIGIRSTATMTVPVKVQWRDTYINDQSGEYLLLGLFYGLMIFFIFFGLHSFYSFRDCAYLFYSAFAFSMLLFFVDLDGIAYQYLWPNSTDWKLRSVRVIAAFSMGLGVLYYTYVLRLKERIVLGFTYGYGGFCLLYAILLLILHPSLTNKATIILASATPVAMVILPILGIRRKRLFAPYMLVAGSVSLIGFFDLLTQRHWIHSSQQFHSKRDENICVRPVCQHGSEPTQEDQTQLQQASRVQSYL